MPSSDVVAAIMERSALTKSQFAAATGISRAQLDRYLKGQSHPRLDIVWRVAQAAGIELDLVVRKPAEPMPEAFMHVLEFGELFPEYEKPPLINLGPVWRAVEQRRVATSA